MSPGSLSQLHSSRSPARSFRQNNPQHHSRNLCPQIRRTPRQRSKPVTLMTIGFMQKGKIHMGQCPPGNFGHCWQPVASWGAIEYGTRVSQTGYLRKMFPNSWDPSHRQAHRHRQENQPPVNPGDKPASGTLRSASEQLRYPRQPQTAFQTCVDFSRYPNPFNESSSACCVHRHPVPTSLSYAPWPTRVTSRLPLALSLVGL